MQAAWNNLSGFQKVLLVGLVFSPMRITAPLPNCFSICESAALNAFCLLSSILLFPLVNQFRLSAVFNLSLRQTVSSGFTATSSG
jgi:hypothetical protein